jgi:hypothetical protein
MDNCKINLKEMACGDLEYIDLTQDIFPVSSSEDGGRKFLLNIIKGRHVTADDIHSSEHLVTMKIEEFLNN